MADTSENKPTPKTFRCLRTELTESGKAMNSIVSRSVDELPAGELLVRVRYSSLNYKDALSGRGNRGVTRNYPHTPGVDAAGVVEQSESTDFRPGDPVIVTSYDLGVNTDGAFSEYIRVPASWAVPQPAGLTSREAMTIGTAGFTAALCRHRLESAGLEEGGEVVVTGATGGVGIFAVALMAQAGFRVAAVTGKAQAEPLLRSTGAESVLSRDQLLNEAGPKPLGKSRWAGAVDAVGGPLLAAILKSTRYGGAVACCGLAASAELATTVYPFILRGVSLLGVDSVLCPMPLRKSIWERLASDWKVELDPSLIRECQLEDLDTEFDTILRGGQTGRILVRISED